MAAAQLSRDPGGLFHFRWVIVGLFVVALFATGFLFTHAPTGFTPDEDQGFFIVTVQAPEGSSIDQTERITRKVEGLIRQRSEVLDIFDVIGFGFTGNGPNKATMFIRLKDWKDRPGFQHSVTAIIYSMYPVFAKVPDAQIFAFNFPPVQGIGNVGGFQFELEDTGNIGLDKLTALAHAYQGAAFQDPALGLCLHDVPRRQPAARRRRGPRESGVRSTFRSRISSTRCRFTSGRSTSTTSTICNRSYRVYVQADTPYRSTHRGPAERFTSRSSTGALMPLNNARAIHSTITKSRAGDHALQSVPLDRAQRIAGAGLRFGRCDLEMRDRYRGQTRPPRRQLRVVGALARRDRSPADRQR